MSVLAVCQRQLESELLLVKKEMCLPAESGVSGTAKVPGHVGGCGRTGHGSWSRVDTPSASSLRRQVTRTAARGAFSRPAALAVLVRSVLRFPTCLV